LEGKTQGGWGGRRVTMKETPVFGFCFLLGIKIPHAGKMCI